MNVKYIGEYYKIRLKKNKIYFVISVKNGWYKIKDELGEVGFYPPEEFKIMKNGEIPYITERTEEEIKKVIEIEKEKFQKLVEWENVDTLYED